MLEWLGYAASVIVAVSMLMNSILKLRWINLVGSLLFSVYGFLIGSIPVGILNLFIALVNVVFLYKTYTQKDIFNILEVKTDSKYLNALIDFHQEDIYKFYPHFKIDQNKEYISFLILKNLAVAGAFLGEKKKNGLLEIQLDYVLKEYRDFRLGKFVYIKHLDYFRKQGIQKIQSPSISKRERKYWEKMTFTKADGRDFFYKKI